MSEIGYQESLILLSNRVSEAAIILARNKKSCKRSVASDPKHTGSGDEVGVLNLSFRVNLSYKRKRNQIN